MVLGNYRWSLAGLLVVALSVRLGAAVAWQQHLGDPHRFGFPDSHGYWHLAGQLYHGQPYEYGREYQVFRAPAYPLVLAGLFWVTGDDPPRLWARAVGAVLGTVAVLGIWWLGCQLFDPQSGLWAGWLACWYPGAIGMSVFILGEVLFAPLMVAQLGCWVAARRATRLRRQIGWAVGVGVLAGLATLARPSWILFTPGAAALVVLAGRQRGQDAWQGLLILGAISVTMLPWWTRNYRVTGTFVPTTLQVGASLYDGLNPRATGGSDMWFSDEFFRAQQREDARGTPQRGTLETRLNARLRSTAWRWAVAHPGRVVQLAGRKFLRTWNIWPNTDDLGSWRVRVLVAAGYVPILALGLVGCWRYARRGWGVALCYLPALYFTTLHMVFVGSIRYRQPAVLVFTVLAAAVLVSWWDRGREPPPVQAA